MLADVLCICGEFVYLIKQQKINKPSTPNHFLLKKKNTFLNVLNALGV